MQTRLKIWRKLLSPLDQLESFCKKRRLRKSFQFPFFLGSRDSFTFYENGRSVTIWAELLANREYQRMVARDPILKWDDNGKILTQEEKQKVLQKFYEYLYQRNVKWIFSDEIESLSS